MKREVKGGEETRLRGQRKMEGEREREREGRKEMEEGKY